jgi:hypothetical protein
MTVRGHQRAEWAWRIGTAVAAAGAAVLTTWLTMHDQLLTQGQKVAALEERLGKVETQAADTDRAALTLAGSVHALGDRLDDFLDSFRSIPRPRR